MKILITGSTGFVGQALTRHLVQQGYTLTAAVRHPADALPGTVRQIVIGDLLPDTNWSQAVSSIDTVIHLAARVSVMQDTAADPLTAFRDTNTAATLNLARQAAAAGVRRFIYISTIKVNGETTAPGKPFTPDDNYIPTDPYGLSKYEAEQGLRGLAAQTGMAVVIIRPPLVYGPGVKANFLSMMSWLQKGIPLPLGAICNQRSLVALDNLVDLVAACINHPAAANQIFLVSDGEDLSTTALLQRLGAALGKSARLLPVPQGLLIAGFTLLGKRAIAQRLCDSLQIDITKTRSLLGWAPPVNVDEALRKTAVAYLEKHR
jgi:UDP-glucose 4-epimerase